MKGVHQEEIIIRQKHYIRKSRVSVDSDKCRTVTDVTKRKDLLRKKRRCFLCTRGNHVARDCPTKRKCYNCKVNNHHTSICERSEFPRDDRMEKNETKYEKIDGDHKKDVDGENTLSNSAFASKNTILMQTAQLNVKAVSRSGTKDGIVCKVILTVGVSAAILQRRQQGLWGHQCITRRS